MSRTRVNASADVRAVISEWGNLDPKSMGQGNIKALGGGLPEVVESHPDWHVRWSSTRRLAERMAQGWVFPKAAYVVTHMEPLSSNELRVMGTGWSKTADDRIARDGDGQILIAIPRQWVKRAMMAAGEKSTEMLERAPKLVIPGTSNKTRAKDDGDSYLSNDDS